MKLVTIVKLHVEGGESGENGEVGETVENGKIGENSGSLDRHGLRI